MKNLVESTNIELLKKLQELDEGDKIIIKIPENLNESVMKYNGCNVKAGNMERLLFRKELNLVTAENIDLVKSLMDDLAELYKCKIELEQQIMIESLSKEVFQYLYIEKLGYFINGMVNFIEIFKPSCDKINKNQ